VTYGLKDSVTYLDCMFVAAVSDVVGTAAQDRPSWVVRETAVLYAPEDVL